MRFTSVLLLLISAFTFVVYASPIEVVEREAIPIPKTSPAITGDETLRPRAATYSFVGCNQRNFQVKYFSFPQSVTIPLEVLLQPFSLHQASHDI